MYGCAHTQMKCGYWTLSRARRMKTAAHFTSAVDGHFRSKSGRMMRRHLLKRFWQRLLNGDHALDPICDSHHSLGAGIDNTLEPVMTANTIGFHCWKHHKGYVDNLNKLVAGTEGPL